MIRSFKNKRPVIHPTAFIHPACEIIGDVRIGAHASIWPGCVLRGDTDKIVIGAGSNVQDNSVIHCDKGMPTLIGKGVVIGHRAIIHGAKIADDVLVGMGAIVMAAKIGRQTLIGSGALLLDGAVIAPRSLVLGSPAKVIRPLKPAEIASIRQGAAGYAQRAKDHAKTSSILTRI